MTDLRRPITLFATVALVLAACGGGGAGGGGTTPAAPADGAATSVPTQAAASEVPSEGAGGGGTGVGVCELVTADELAGIFNVSVTMTVLAGPPDNCIVDGTDGRSLAAWSLTGTGAKAIFGSYVSGSDANEVPGIGDVAIYSPDGHQLTVVKGDAFMVIAIYASAGSDDERYEFAKQIGASAAGRM